MIAAPDFPNGKRGGRKVRAPQGRVLRNAESRRREESATENKPPRREAPVSSRGKGETVR